MSPKQQGVPEWARDAIWYQIFPERFRNGSRANDPCEPGIPGWKVSPWGQDWYRQEAWEKRRGDFFRSVFDRRFGGDLIGVREKLDYLQDLGINAVYLNPVFQAPSLHKYDAACLHHIDPTFGPDRDGDLKSIARAKETEDPATWIWTSADRYFLDLVGEMHRRGMRVIIDGVFNHAGREFFAFRDLLARGRASRYRDWFKIRKWNADGTFEYDGWFGHRALPEFGRTKNDLAAPVREYLFNITRRWMAPQGDAGAGVDGWRLDVAFCVPHGFWRKWRRHVKAINPDAYLTAEIVTLAPEWLKGDQFDAVMNYAWLYPTYSFFAPGPKAIPARTFARELDRIRRAYRPGVFFALQNLLDSHDVGRIATMLANPTGPVTEFQAYFESSRVAQRRDLDTRKPTRRVYDRLRQLVVFQMTFPGAPMIYHGTEAGMWGANDPCDRQPMLWDDVDYEPETHTPAGRCRPRARAPDQGLLRFFKRMIALRRQFDSLRRGELRWLRTGHARVLGYERRLGMERIGVLLNASEEALAFEIRNPALGLPTEGSIGRKGRVVIKPGGWFVFLSLHHDAVAVRRSAAGPAFGRPSR